MKPKTAMISFLGIVTLAWAWDAMIANPPTGDMLWVLRRQLIYLTGVWAIALMSLVMVLSTRPAWLETPLGGMDKIYRLHKWAGITAIVAGVAHWLLELAGGPISQLIGREGRPRRDAVLPLLTDSRDLAKDMGEWIIYILIAMLVLTLWKRFPYRTWRTVHRIMPALFLGLVFHAVALTPLPYWSGPTGILLAALLAAGSAAAVVALTQQIGRSHRYRGTIASAREAGAGVLEVVCAMKPDWPGHRPGQFAFVTFDRREGAHPFTIASASEDTPNRITFQIKALGDYTRRLRHRLAAGQPVEIEGPYGRLDYRRARPGATQVWIAGGIGITPFLSWLTALAHDPAAAPRAHLHYCVRDASADPFIHQVMDLCASLPAITLQVHDARNKDMLNADRLYEAHGAASPDAVMDVWFCGPRGFASSLRRGFRALGLKGVTVHQEAFDMR